MDVRSLMPGTVVHNRYKVEKELGAGGFGVTYRVTDLKENNKTVAMKEYMPLDMCYRPVGSQEVKPLSEGKQAHYEKFRDKFIEEAQNIYKFRGHPNIVEVKHLFCENNTAYYIMEYVDGMDLRKFLAKQNQKISWDMLRPIIAQVVAGLKQIHSGGLIHCDISTDNIFLMNSGSVKLLDFGAARSTLRGSVETSVIVAKPGYSPYEQIRGKGMGPWTDVYALAVTIYRSVTGGMPPEASERIIDDKTIWPSQMGIVIPSPGWENALKRAMALRPEERFQSVTEFWEALNPKPVQPPKPPSPPKPPIARDGRTIDPIQGYHADPSRGSTTLVGVQGVYTGAKLVVNRDLVLGVDPTRCHVTLPAGTPGISRVHLRLWPYNGYIMVMDLGSTYGTWMDGTKLVPGQVYRVNYGSVLYLGGGQVFRAQ